MPTSKKRKKPTTQKRTSGNPAAVHPESGHALASIEGVRDRFRDLAVTEGHLFPAIKGYEPLGPAGECWTNAWTYAQATGLGYAEGVALMPNGWHVHAWCVTDDGAVIEPTLGYDHATEYRGWCLDKDKVAVLNATITPEEPACSIIEAGLGSGVTTWPQIRDMLTFVPGTV